MRGRSAGFLIVVAFLLGCEAPAPVGTGEAVDPFPLLAAPENLRMVQVGDTSASIEWNAVPEASKYVVDLDGRSDSLFIQETLVRLEQLSPATSYVVSVAALDEAGRRGTPAAFPFTTAPPVATPGAGSGASLPTGSGPPAPSTAGSPQIPPAPTGLRASSAGQTTAGLTWDGTPGASGYNIYRDGMRVTSNVSASTYAFNDLVCAQTYRIEVTAVNSAGESPRSIPLSVTTSSCPSSAAITPPAKPGGLSVSSKSASGFTLSWSSQADATSYNVFLNTAVSKGGLTSTMHTFTGLSADTSYTAAASAVNSAGESPASDPLSIRTLPIAPTGVTVGSVTTSSMGVVWTSTGGTVTQYKVYLDATPTPSATASGSPVTLTGLNSNMAFSVTVTAVGEGGESGPSVAVSAKTKVSLSKDVQPIFTNKCSCHQSSPFSGNLDLRSGSSYSQLVNVTATFPCDDLTKRVMPNVAEQGSILWSRIAYDGGCGKMPKPPAPGLNAGQPETIKDWIDQGAPNN